MRFTTGEYYHLINRGTEGRRVFLDTSDYKRFLHSMEAFNSSLPIELRFWNHSEVEPPNLQKRDKKKLVEILSYCLMKNHVHILIKCNRSKDASIYLQKLFGGYTMYFNTKYQRRGVLFQGKTKVSHADETRYLEHLFRYIHLNPLDYTDRKWREHEMHTVTQTRKVIVEYPWSSIRALLDKEKNSFVNTRIAKQFIGSPKEFLKDLLSWSSEEFSLYGGRTSEYE